jgi:hypothetical protein
MVIKTYAVLIALGVCMAMPATAQKMFRCGNTYQDRPCEGEQEGKVVKGMSAPDAPSSAQSRVTPDCSQRGIAAQKIKWARETGQTQEQQEAAASSETQRNLIADVYSRQGTSVQIRAAVEADCMTERERAARAAELPKAAALLPNGQTAESARSDADRSAMDAGQSVPSGSARSTQQTCQTLTERLETARSNQRRGGNGRNMDELNQQARSIGSKMRDLGC